MGNERSIAVVGLGYVGLPVAVAFGRRQRLVGFDINKVRVEELRRGEDRTGEISPSELAEANIEYTSDAAGLRESDFIIVAVPTPVDGANRPDLSILVSASRSVGTNLSKGSIVVFESTVYPGTTEEICIPALEQASGMKAGEDFHVGYSPERINPGDTEHTFTKIMKVVSGQTPEVTRVIAGVYGSVVTAGIHSAPSIKVAEAAKVIENTQRDLNIALMNELSLIFHRLNIDTNDVLTAAKTKWNFLPFSPGLVGGHCIGVDPYYLTHKAEQLGYHPQVILAGRRINDGMGEVVADQVILGLIRQGLTIRGSRITVLGLTFKEDVPDLRNSGVLRIVKKLREYRVEVQLHDPLASEEEVLDEFGIAVTPFDALEPGEGVVLAVPHRSYAKEGWGLPRRLLKTGKGVVADVKGVLPRGEIPAGIDLWRL
ncbi:MAG TPA: nucleotide sugar dehydrogenase [Thermoanaerobaculia bacterium]|nr:nucleotide sugar dehydrogenase [Thermoanaerobaculia bacterium]